LHNERQIISKFGTIPLFVSLSVCVFVCLFVCCHWLPLNVHTRESERGVWLGKGIYRIIQEVGLSLNTWQILLESRHWFYISIVFFLWKIINAKMMIILSVFFCFICSPWGILSIDLFWIKKIIYIRTV
jgi:hypothetical protein